MKPRIDRFEYGLITVAGAEFDHDVIIRRDGVAERKEPPSGAEHGSSHVISLDEARQVWRKGIKRLIIGTGRFGLVELSNEAAGFLQAKECRPELLPTRKAVRAWNKAKGPVIGLFHITC